MRALVVGAGVSGLTAAVMLKEAGHEVTVVESRSHSGGNCHDTQVNGNIVHQYGPHLFHTNIDRVWDFVRRFSEFVPYEHHVLARTFNCPYLLSIPYNQHTERTLGRRLEDSEIIDMLFKDYSQKMWGIPWAELPPEVTSRVPQRRTTSDQRYFTDKYQAMPSEGYYTLFRNMVYAIGEDNIQYNVRLDHWRDIDSDVIIFTGSIDEYYKYEHGVLGYRTLDIEVIKDFPRQPAAVINECNKLPFTRTTDYSWIDRTSHHKTMVTREYPRDFNYKCESDIRYYPMKWGSNADMYLLYSMTTPVIPTVFCGRLGTYRYMNIDTAILDAMEKIDKLLGDDQ
jgi:UDP-galactopyranose mutase